MTKELEIIGRLQLWEGALRDCIQCIELCGRMHLTMQSPELGRQEHELQQHFERVTGRILNPHVAYSNDQSVLDSYRRLLPTERECSQIIFHLYRLAVIYFQQVYMSGWNAPGVVLGNMTTEAKELRDKLERQAFQEQPEFARFQQLKNVVQALRDGVIAHADGSRMQVRHQPNAVSYTLESIDPETARAMQGMIPALHEAVRHELHSRLSAQANDGNG